MRAIRAEAPSNLALVKYMGKSDAALNLPANASLSLTLRGLCTTTELREMPGSPTAPRIHWNGQVPEGSRGRAPELGAESISKLARHLERVALAAPAILGAHRLKARVPSGSIELRTANTFPASSGIASSASGLAAFTLAALALHVENERDFECALRDE